MIKLVAFDLDGTIGDTIPLCMNAFKEAVTPYINHELTDKEIVQTFGLNEEGMIKQVIADDNWKQALNDFYVIYEEMHILCPRPFEGISALINELHEKGKTVALITGKGEISCAITLKQFGMETCFDRIETGSAEKNRKSEAMRVLQQYYQICPDEMVYIGDAISDIEACNTAQVQCLSAAWASSAVKEQLKAYNPGHVFGSIKLLRGYLLDERNNIFPISF